MPRRPVDDHRRLVREEGSAVRDHRLVRTPHALGVDHALGHAGRARGEQDLGDGVGRRPWHARRRRPSGAASSAAKSGVPLALRVTTISTPGGTDRFDGARVRAPSAANTRPGVSRPTMCRACRSRTRSANRPARSARRECRHSWPRARAARARDRCRRGSRSGARRERSRVQQRRADAAHLLQGLRVGDGAPARRRVALRHEHAVGRLARPMHQALGQLLGIGRQRAASAR